MSHANNFFLFSGDLPPEAEELPHHDGGGQGLGVRGLKGQGGDAAAHGSPVRAGKPR